MPLPTNTPTSSAAQANNDLAIKAIQRLAYVTKKAFDDFWNNGTPATITAAEDLNQWAAANDTTAAAMFEEHATTAAFCAARVPTTAPMFQQPPIDMLTIFTPQGTIDIDLLTTALA